MICIQKCSRERGGAERWTVNVDLTEKEGFMQHHGVIRAGVTGEDSSGRGSSVTRPWVAVD